MNKISQPNLDHNKSMTTEATEIVHNIFDLGNIQQEKIQIKGNNFSGKALERICTDCNN